jgi:hypothetical protein
VNGTFVTTTKLSDRARQFAEQLEVDVQEGFPLADYPRIKCNIGKDGARIYHLPFDQQYDTTVVDQPEGSTGLRPSLRRKASASGELGDGEDAAVSLRPKDERLLAFPKETGFGLPRAEPLPERSFAAR